MGEKGRLRGEGGGGSREGEDLSEEITLIM